MIYQFKCPKCGNHVLEEVVVNAVASFPIIEIDDEDSHVYDDAILHDGELARYQCFNCGFVVTTDRDELFNSKHLYSIE